ncbi:unnamed protein product [Acanthosepion pharaonis]|uniref:Uncharacterized protein n=1 Tax=Acanthosepion pharaonis TaxID=158019 RepID=A0A812B673_ACAPH|nr:unnamed protein product [Sepia pharaonis]
MHSRASLFCLIDNTAHLFNHHRTSTATPIISIIPTTDGQVIIATQFSLQAIPQAPPPAPCMHEARPHSSPAPMIIAKLVTDRHSFTTATVLVSLNPWAQGCTAPLNRRFSANGISSSSSHSLSSSSSLRLGSIPASSECPAGVRLTSLSLRRLTSDTEAPVSTRTFTFLSPSNTLQVKSGPSFSKRYTCAFLLPVGSLPSYRFLDNRDGCSVRCGPSFSCEDRFVSAPYNLTKSTPHVQHLRGLTCNGGHPASYFFTGDPSAFPGPFSFSVGGHQRINSLYSQFTVSLCHTPASLVPELATSRAAFLLGTALTFQSSSTSSLGSRIWIRSRSFFSITTCPPGLLPTPPRVVRWSEPPLWLQLG